MKISIVTPSQESRYGSLLLLKEMIKEQTAYKKIGEWVLIDGTKNQKGKFDLFRLQEDFVPKIRIISWEQNCKIGRLRNKVNNAATGDLLICMDDDDYYPNIMIEKVIEAFEKNPTKLICGCTDTYMYDLFISRQFKFDTFGDKHAINSTMSFKKTYLENHKHDEKVDFGEEASFTNNFTEDIIQIAPEYTANTICHHTNTYNKRILVTQFYNGAHAKLKESSKNLIPKHYLKEMKTLYLKQTVSPYDIVYFGGASVPWSPKDKSIGGSEQAIQYLSEKWVSMGYKVAVYNTITIAPAKHNGVDYYSWVEFPFYSKFKKLIIWRPCGMSCIFYAKINAEKIFLDLHDSPRNLHKPLYDKFLEYNSKLDRIMFKSNFHKSEFEMAGDIKLKDEQYAIIPNGLRTAEFTDTAGTVINGISRDKYRFCYCSCYTRGLENILRHIWPQIIAIEPRAELHIYYGMDLVQSAEFKKTILELIALTPNVMNHNKKPLDIIAREKHISTFQLYFTNAQSEIDCISVREAVLCGCIPIISKYGVFAERDGLQIDANIDDVNCLKEIGKFLGGLLNDETKIKQITENMKESTLCMDWSETAKEWIKLF